MENALRFLADGDATKRASASECTPLPFEPTPLAVFESGGLVMEDLVAAACRVVSWKTPPFVSASILSELGKLLRVSAMRVLLQAMHVPRLAAKLVDDGFLPVLTHLSGSGPLVFGQPQQSRPSVLEDDIAIRVCPSVRL